jgi:hypothetical protein
MDNNYYSSGSLLTAFILRRWEGVRSDYEYCESLVNGEIGVS